MAMPRFKKSVALLLDQSLQFAALETAEVDAPEGVVAVNKESSVVMRRPSSSRCAGYRIAPANKSARESAIGMPSSRLNAPDEPDGRREFAEAVLVDAQAT